MPGIILITGGARSGKSNFAVKLASQSKGKVAFIATAVAEDDEMKRRITLHKKSRPQEWTTVEEPLNLSKAIESVYDHDVIIIDCITLYLNNLISNDGTIDDEFMLLKIKKMIESAKRFHGTIIIISNELGMGIVPENRLAREFRDVAGKANQMIAESADKVYVCFSGIPVQIKGSF